MGQLDLDGNDICIHKELTFCSCMVIGCHDQICKKCGARISGDEQEIIHRRRACYISKLPYI